MARYLAVRAHKGITKQTSLRRNQKRGYTTMYNRALQKQKGFTIIEVMIVLAIAGVIMMLLFLVVPTLQRNNRNTQIQNDAAALLTYIGEYSIQKNGALPAGVDEDANGAVLASDGTNDINLGNIRAGIDIEFADGAQSAYATDGSDSGKVRLVVNAKCNNPDDGATVAQRRSYAVQYVVESGGDDIPRCE